MLIDEEKLNEALCVPPKIRELVKSILKECRVDHAFQDLLGNSTQALVLANELLKSYEEGRSEAFIPEINKSRQLVMDSIDKLIIALGAIRNERKKLFEV